MVEMRIEEAGIEEAGRVDRGDGVALAWAHLLGAGPTVVFLPGFRSDMEGAKAVALRDWCRAHRRAMLRFDYSGHGQSGGAFTDGTIGRWAADARLVIETRLAGEMLLVGSSMGGWIALLLAPAMPVIGLVGIAAAPDFTESLIWAAMAPAERQRLMEHGHLDIPSQYGDPCRITRALIEDGRLHPVLGKPILVACKVRLLQGQRDDDVPWETALRIAEQLAADDVQVVLLKDGDHRLSRPEDLALLCRTVAELLGEDGA